MERGCLVAVNLVHHPDELDGVLVSSNNKQHETDVMIARLHAWHPWYRSTFGYALTGAALLWAALPPMNLWPLAWIAPVWWVLLIRAAHLPPLPEGPRPRLRPLPLAMLAAGFFLTWLAVDGLFLGRQYREYWLAEIVFWPLALMLLIRAVRLAERRLYVVLWLVGLFFWLAALQWLRLPHWATGFGWLAMSVYFAFYLPLFVGLARVAVHRLRVPVILAAPVVWTGLELARAHVLGGMTMASLAHTQYRWTGLIQVSDVAGAFGVSFVVMFVAACVARMLPCDGRPRALWPAVPAMALLAAVLTYGHFRTAEDTTRPGPRIVLIQGCIDTQMQTDAAMQDTIYRHYMDLSAAALKRYGKVDLLVWPESMFSRTLWVTHEPGAARPEWLADVSDADFPLRLEYAAATSREKMLDTTHTLGVPMILGVDREHFGPKGSRIYNAATLVTPEGEILAATTKCTWSCSANTCRWPIASPGCNG